VLVVDVLIVRDDVGRGERRLHDARASEKERKTRDMHVSRPKTPVDAPPVSGVAHGELAGRRVETHADDEVPAGGWRTGEV
jgi:hypothetical protein